MSDSLKYCVGLSVSTIFALTGAGSCPGVWAGPWSVARTIVPPAFSQTRRSPPPPSPFAIYCISFMDATLVALEIRPAAPGLREAFYRSKNFCQKFPILSVRHMVGVGDPTTDCQINNHTV